MDVLLLAIVTLCWDPSKPFVCHDPPFERGAPEGYYVYMLGRSTWRPDECCWGLWSIVASVPAADDESPCASFDVEDPQPGYLWVWYVSAWNSHGESDRAQPACNNPPREGINPQPCPDGSIVGGSVP